MDLILAAIFGFAGGMIGGLVGVGGGILFVPALVIFLDEPQVRAEATSLLAIVIVSIAGTWRQRRYGNVRLGDAAVIGALSIAGVAIGVVVANSVPERALEIGFAILALAIAAQLAVRALRTPAEASD
ncbi:MAG TPA: sulfite exporter TauE/SafE family protein [Solirubrobacterales bacterium]